MIKKGDHNNDSFGTPNGLVKSQNTIGLGAQAQPGNVDDLMNDL